MKNIATHTITSRLSADLVYTHVADYTERYLYPTGGLRFTFARDPEDPRLSVARLTFRNRTYAKTFSTSLTCPDPTAAEILTYLVNCNVEALLQLLGMATAEELVSHRKGS